MNLFGVVINPAHQLTHHNGGEQQALGAEGLPGRVIEQRLFDDDSIHRFTLLGEQLNKPLTGFDCTEINRRITIHRQPLTADLHKISRLEQQSDRECRTSHPPRQGPELNLDERD